MSSISLLAKWLVQVMTLQIVEQVIKLVNRAEFKRKQAPPGLKITDRAFGTGWRMPIASPGLQEI